ncbi:MAG: glycosyltransferase [Imperialibacter sp.]|uniref:glycosyltransferase n=1 Tax=Imperialibacter sp. TaxID=2038411 RepID=UPI0032ED8B5E
MRARLILYISYDGLTDPLGQSQVLPYLIALSAQGYYFHILSFEKEAAYQENKSIIDKLTSDANIVWHGMNYHKSPPILSTVYDSLRMKAIATKLHAEFQFKAIWCRSYIPALAGLYLKKRFRVPFIFDMRGFWPDERVEGGSWPQSNPVFRAVYRYFKQKEQLLLAEADHVVVLTNKAKEILEMRQLHDNPVPKAISVVPCCVDSELFDPSRISVKQKSEARAALGIGESERVLVYAGSLGTWYMVREMLEYFAGLSERTQGWKFLVLTKDNPEQLYRDADELIVARKNIIVRSCKRAEMPLYLSLGDLAISYIQPVFSKQASSPTKLAEYMAMGLPVVCSEGVGDVDKLMREAGLSDLKVSTKLGVAPFLRDFARNRFSLDVALKVYLEVLSLSD